jgi:hypothetical protein
MPVAAMVVTKLGLGDGPLFGGDEAKTSKEWAIFQFKFNLKLDS